MNGMDRSIYKRLQRVATGEARAGEVLFVAVPFLPYFWDDRHGRMWSLFPETFTSLIFEKSVYYNHK
jgi:hypothetical protein